MALNSYIAQVQFLLHDAAASFYSVANITLKINEARRQVAAEGQCIRILPPNSSGVASITGLPSGTGYTSAPTVTFSGPQLINGVLATGTATVSGGSVTAITITNAGSGYVIPPNITFTGGGGSNATATAVLAAANFSVVNQELYTFSSVNTFVQQTTGVNQILDLAQVAVYWGNMKPALSYRPWRIFNAYFRAYPQFSNFPFIWSKYGQGVGGSLYFWPIPSQVLGMDWDCICSPVDLVTDTTPEAIPAPFDDCVQYYATYLLFLNSQRASDAEQMLERYRRQMARARAFTQRNVISDYYGTWGS